MILKKGSKGKEVKELQEYLEIGSDGVFGPGTKISKAAIDLLTILIESIAE